MDTVYSQVLRYTDIIPVDRSSREHYTSQHHWLTRLQSVGPYEYSASVSDYKGLYILLRNNGFDVDRALVTACTEGLEEFATYLSSHATGAARASCVEETHDLAITKSITVDDADLLSVLTRRSSDPRAMEVLLEGVVLGEESSGRYRELLLSPSSGVVAWHISEDAIPYNASDCSPTAAAVFDSRGYIYHIDRAIEEDLENSVLAWCDTMPSRQSIMDKLLLSIGYNTKVGVILLSALQVSGDMGLESLVAYAVKSDNYWVLKRLPYTHRDLSMAIALGNSNSVRAMQSISTPTHRVQRRRFPHGL